jgi:UDP-glucose 4-epimerase
MPLPRTALVSGVTGFIGAALARRLIGAGIRVFGLVRPTSSLARLAVSPGLEVIEVGGPSRADLGRALAGIRADVVFNLAAAGVHGAADPDELHSGNAGLLLNLLQEVAGWTITRFIHAGSCSEYGPVEPPARLVEKSPLYPSSPYGAAKAAAWLRGRVQAGQLGLPLVGLRLFGCYGPGEAPWRLVPYATGKLAAGEPVDLTPGDQVRDFLHIDDVVSALWSAAIAGLPSGSVFNVCSGQPTSVRALVGLLTDVLHRPASLLHWGARPARGDEPAWIVGDPAAFHRATGWAPRLSLRAGLEQTVADLLAMNRRTVQAA